MRISINTLPRLLSQKPEVELGCIVDTNAFFAAAMPLDRLNAWAEKTFCHLRASEIPTITNINIRSEFLDLQRRVLLPEGLVTLYEETEDKTSMNPVLQTQLRILKTLKETAAKDNKLFKFNDQQIKKYRTLCSRFRAKTARIPGICSAKVSFIHS